MLHVFVVRGYWNSKAAVWAVCDLHTADELWTATIHAPNTGGCSVRSVQAAVGAWVSLQAQLCTFLPTVHATSSTAMSVLKSAVGSVSYAAGMPCLRKPLASESAAVGRLYRTATATAATSGSEGTASAASSGGRGRVAAVVVAVAAAGGEGIA